MGFASPIPQIEWLALIVSHSGPPYPQEHDTSTGTEDAYRVGVQEEASGRPVVPWSRPTALLRVRDDHPREVEPACEKLGRRANRTATR